MPIGAVVPLQFNAAALHLVQGRAMGNAAPAIFGPANFRFVTFGIQAEDLVDAAGIAVAFADQRSVWQLADNLVPCIRIRHLQIAPRLNSVYTAFYQP